MSLISRRIEKGWSQEDLASISGVSVRTIQRAESGQKLGLESLKCIAAVLETSVSTLIEEQESKMSLSSDVMTENAEKEAIEYVRQLKWFYFHLALFVTLLVALGVLNYVVSPETLWVHYVGFAWLVGLAAHTLYMTLAFGSFGAQWEQRQFEKRLRRY